MSRGVSSDNCMGREGNKRESDKEVNRVGFEHRKKKRGNNFCANALIFIQKKIIKKGKWAYVKKDLYVRKSSFGTRTIF